MGERSKKEIFKENTVFNKFKKALEEYSMLDGACSVGVGFSGGGDSAALLHILKKYGDEKGIRIVAIHINHMIRGEEAIRDEEFCRELCHRMGIEFFSCRGDIPRMAREKGQSLEECARNFRYEFFEKIRLEEGIEKIATAHNCDDNLETVIFNLSRGSGIAGLCGIPPVRGNIIRPLIYCDKAEILEYCEENGVPHIYDSTNSDTDYTRNHIRHNIVPELRRINPRVCEAVMRSTENLRRDNETLAAVARDGKYDLSNAPDGVLIRILTDKYEEFTGGEEVLLSHHREALLKLLKNGAEGGGVSLPLNVIARKRGREIVFERDKREKKKRGLDGDKKEYPLLMGVNYIPDLDLAVEIFPVGEKSKISENVYKLSMKAILCFDTIYAIDALYCRARADGDKYRFGGMTRSVKKLLQEGCLSALEKKNYPVLCDEKGIVLLPGFKKRDGEYEKGQEHQIIFHLFKNH